MVMSFGDKAIIKYLTVSMLINRHVYIYKDYKDIKSIIVYKYYSSLPVL